MLMIFLSYFFVFMRCLSKRGLFFGPLVPEVFLLALSFREENSTKKFKKNLWDQSIALVTYLKNQENTLELKV